MRIQKNTLHSLHSGKNIQQHRCLERPAQPCHDLPSAQQPAWLVPAAPSSGGEKNRVGHRLPKFCDFFVKILRPLGQKN